jgi:hypothetical protein
MGRPSSYSEGLALRIFELAKAGKTDAEIAGAIGISVATLANWKNRYPDFLDALKDAKEVADQLVEASLFRRAMGYSHSAVKFFCDKGKIVSQPYVEHYAPDTVACIFWLKNRRPDLWRDTIRNEHDFGRDAPIRMSYVPGQLIEKPVKALSSAGDSSDGKEGRDGSEDDE